MKRINKNTLVTVEYIDGESQPEPVTFGDALGAFGPRVKRVADSESGYWPDDDDTWCVVWDFDGWYVVVRNHEGEYFTLAPVQPTANRSPWFA